MKIFIFIGFSLVLWSTGFPQVSVSSTGNSPDESAMLDVQSIDKGVLIPRMTTNHRENINSPANGLLVFDSNTESFWFHTSGEWVELIDRTRTLWSQLGSNIYRNTGNVGIGINLPSRLLEIRMNNANVNTSQMYLSQAGGGNSWMNIGFPGGDNYALGADQNDASKFKISYNASGPLGLNTGNLLTLNTAGNLGLGTTLPGYLIDLGSSLGRKLALYNSPSSDSFYGFGISSNTLEFYASDTTNANPKMVLTSSGNVGIGVINPSQPLEINGDLRMGGGADNSDSDAESVVFNGQSDTWYAGVMNELTATATDFFIGKDSEEDGIFHINSNGNIGIGSTNPQTKLFVNAPLSTDPLRVANNGTTRLKVFDNGGTTVGSANTPPALGLRVEGELQPNSDIRTSQDLTIETIGNGAVINIKAGTNEIELDENGNITITTNGNDLTINAGNGNIVMDARNIELNADNQLNLNSSNTLDLFSTGDMTLSSLQNTDISSNNILTLFGSSSSKLDSDDLVDIEAGTQIRLNYFKGGVTGAAKIGSVVSGGSVITGSSSVVVGQ